MKIPDTPSLSNAKRLVRLGSLLGATVLATGCATVAHPNPDDPWESYNRSMFAFNDTVDRALLKPIAMGYDQLMPDPAQTCIHNVFSNLGDVWSAINSFLQGRGHDFFNTLGRVLFNSTMGLGGCIDVASMNGAKRIPNDFGVTLGVWGFDSGPYVVLPILGSSSVRDGTATLGTFAAGVSPVTPVFEIDNVPLRNSIIGLYAVDTRASLLDADKLVNEVALDRYSFIRDAYIQRRNAQVNSRRDGAAPPDYSDDGSLPDYSDDVDAADTGASPDAGASKAAQ
ncbi:VacJ family lipoprotein [Pollutimonas sp. M17]|uniref:MlaA family lipoprotein n=1 Tax=Pollutimonas sp. M17 TaxID=2962065 RepID=UPI0021F3E690|nr:VacJ family lipoprotein [Pollutimonas sp. M17]UYO93896.1 VacJ family lipoprotein [Pollutimonas sp. M17]HWK69403.1 VacJ family lipoprotein [Burkholderiaceae bacterium]